MPTESVGIVQYSGKNKVKPAKAFVKAAIFKCTSWQLTCVVDKHNCDEMPHPSLTGAVPWFSSFGDCSYPLKPVAPWNYQEMGQWPDMTHCRLSHLQTIIAQHSWYGSQYTICSEYAQPGKSLSPGSRKDSTAEYIHANSDESYSVYRGMMPPLDPTWFNTKTLSMKPGLIDTGYAHLSHVPQVFWCSSIKHCCDDTIERVMGWMWDSPALSEELNIDMASSNLKQAANSMLTQIQLKDVKNTTRRGARISIEVKTIRTGMVDGKQKLPRFLSWRIFGT